MERVAMAPNGEGLSTTLGPADTSGVDEQFNTAVREELDEREATARYMGVAGQEFLRQQAENDATLKRLAADGIQVQVPSVDMLKFGTLLDILFGDMQTSPQRLAYELRVQQVIAAQLKDSERQSARAKLTAPGNIPQGRMNGAGLIIPGR